MSLLERFLAVSRTLVRVAVDPDGSVRDVSPALRRRLGLPPGLVPGAPVDSILAPGERERLSAWLAGDVPTGPVSLGLLTARGVSVPTRCVVAGGEDGVELLGELESPADLGGVEELTRLNNELAVLARERARQGRALERARDRAEATLSELETSFWHLRKVQEVLPFCMACGKVRTDPETWLPLVEYLHQNDILVSHAFCPPCAEDWARREGLEGELADT